ncbi:MAG: outer membrane lipoprotein carrier protein LolA [Bacteroidota bacterium]
MRFFSLLSLSIFALFAVAFTTQDSKADKILKESKSTFDKLSDFSADFTYGLGSQDPTNNSRISVQKTGGLKYSKGKYAIVMEDQEIYCDGTTMWIYLPEDEEVNVMECDPEEGIDIESIFKLYQGSSKSRYDGVEKLNGHDCHRIFLSTLDKELEFNQVMVWINTKTSLLEKAVTINRRQTKTTYIFSNIETNQGLGQKAFSFDIASHPDVAVYDER